MKLKNVQSNFIFHEKAWLQINRLLASIPSMNADTTDKGEKVFFFLRVRKDIHQYRVVKENGVKWWTEGYKNYFRISISDGKLRTVTVITARTTQDKGQTNNAETRRGQTMPEYWFFSIFFPFRDDEFFFFSVKDREKRQSKNLKHQPQCEINIIRRRKYNWHVNWRENLRENWRENLRENWRENRRVN